MVRLWSDVLGIPHETISADKDFFELGGHSLKATTLVSKIHRSIGVKVPLIEVFKAPTVEGLSSYIHRTKEIPFASIPLCEKRQYYPTTPAQKRLYYFQQMNPQSNSYNLPNILPLTEEIEPKKLSDIFFQLTRRHESLRTSFTMIDGNPVQLVHEADSITFSLEIHKESNYIDTFFRPFDLSTYPLLRVGLVKSKTNCQILLIELHHIIADGIGMNLLAEEFPVLLAGKQLPPLRLGYKDFAQWFNNSLESHEIKQQEKYWLHRFDGLLPTLDMPTDFDRPAIQTFAGDRIYYTPGQEWSLKMIQLAEKTGTTLFMVLVALYNILLSKYTGKNDIIVGFPVAGRNHADVQRLVGMFVNLLPLRHFPGEEKTFLQFLSEVKSNILQALENQDYPSERLLTQIRFKENTKHKRNPLFDAAISWQNQGTPEFDMGVMEGIPDEYEIGPKVSRFDLLLFAEESKTGIETIIWEYSTELFEEKTVRKIGDIFLSISNQAVDNPDIELGKISITHKLSIASTNLLQDDQQSETGGFVF